VNLRPFWRYYGGKFRAAPRYPAPQHETIIEPFAGSAGYSMRHPARRVILIEKYPVIAGIWRYLIAVSPEEVMRIPDVEHVDDLPTWCPQEARDLVGFWMSSAVASPRRALSKGQRFLREKHGNMMTGWNANTRERIASQVAFVRHWRVIEGDYTDAPNVPATWFVDPPYNNHAGAHYVHGPNAIDFAGLGAWCRSRRGQVIVCENEGADWLPFRFFAQFKGGVTGSGIGVGSREVVWTNEVIHAADR
jgi:hypothetical protein